MRITGLQRNTYIYCIYFVGGGGKMGTPAVKWVELSLKYFYPDNPKVLVTSQFSKKIWNISQKKNIHFKGLTVT